MNLFISNCPINANQFHPKPQSKYPQQPTQNNPTHPTNSLPQQPTSSIFHNNPLTMTTIFDFLSKYSKKRYHTPGHKGDMPFGLGQLDLTEIDDGDFFPTTLLQNAQTQTAQLYDTHQCRYLVGGSSMGLKAAIMSVGGNILTFDNAHKSILDGAKLARVQAFVYPLDIVRSTTHTNSPTSTQTTPQVAPQSIHPTPNTNRQSQNFCNTNHIKPPPTLDTIQKALQQYPDTQAVVLTSPDYFGQTIDKSVVQYIQKSGRLVINDAAHGAHFPFADGLQQHSLIPLADISVVSAHKTLSALTQSSLLFISNPTLIPQVDQNLSLLDTTSPSYLLLGSLEYAVNYAHQNRHKYTTLQTTLQNFSPQIHTLPTTDYTRLVINCHQHNLSGKQLHDRLFAKNIAPEMYTPTHLVLILTPADTPSDILTLQDTLINILQ